MGKAEIVAAQKAAYVQAQDSALESALGACYDQGVLDDKGESGTLTQADLDAAVKAAVDAKDVVIADLQAQVGGADAAKVAAVAAVKLDISAKIKAVEVDNMALADQLAAEGAPAPAPLDPQTGV